MEAPMPVVRLVILANREFSHSNQNAAGFIWDQCYHQKVDVAFLTQSLCVEWHLGCVPFSAECAPLGYKMDSKIKCWTLERIFFCREYLLNGESYSLKY